MKYEITKGSEKDFEGAPEWCTHIIKSDASHKLAYEASDRAVKGNPWAWVGGGFITQRYDQFVSGRVFTEIIAERRPITEPVWDVSTPPSVGIECEVLFTSEGSVFERARILHVGDDGIVGRWLTGDSAGGLFDYMYIPHDYRPIRSPEDVARDEAIAAMCDIGYTLPAAIRFSKEEMSALYDALSGGKIPGIPFSK